MLSDAQIAEFRRQGYLVVEDVLGAAELAAIRREYAALLDALCQGWGIACGGFEETLIAAYRAGFDWFQPMDISLPGDRIATDTPFHVGPAVLEMITAPRLLDLVEDLIGPEITSNPIQHVRIKPPMPDLRADECRAHIAATDWHQDRAVALPEADQTDMITVWLAITDATEANGCLKLCPFEAAPEMLPHCPQRQTAIARGYIDEAAAVPLPVRAGGAVILHPLVPHASLPNRSDTIRWSFDLRYNVTGQPTGRAHFPSFVARSRRAPQTELRDWRQWRAMWEAARARLAQSAHIELHRWRADAPFCA